jgi:glucosamine-6-phosphate deaminase
MEAEEVMILVSGVKKAVALQQALEGSVSHLYTITALQMHKKAIIVADEEACLELKLKTYKYFLEIEDEFSYIDKMCENFLKK